MRFENRLTASRLVRAILDLGLGFVPVLLTVSVLSGQEVPLVSWDLANPKFYRNTQITAPLAPSLLRVPGAAASRQVIKFDVRRANAEGSAFCMRQYSQAKQRYVRRLRRAPTGADEQAFFGVFARTYQFCSLLGRELVPSVSFDFLTSSATNYVLQSIDLTITNSWGTIANSFQLASGGGWALDNPQYSLHFSTLQSQVVLNGTKRLAFAGKGSLVLDVSPADYPLSQGWELPHDLYAIMVSFTFLSGLTPVTVISGPILIEI
jgi:hypothetical protein